jgi:hypothetical protein
VAATQRHASGPSSCGRPPLHSVRRPLLHLVAYSSTNKYEQVQTGEQEEGEREHRQEAHPEVYFPCTTATMLMMTATVKAMDGQRLGLPNPLVQFNVDLL